MFRKGVPLSRRQLNSRLAFGLITLTLVLVPPIAVSVLIAIGQSSPIQAQSVPSAPKHKFEVASIKPVTPGSENYPTSIDTSTGKPMTVRYTWRVSGLHYNNYGASLKELVAEAFRIQAYRINPGMFVVPDWLNDEARYRFALQAVMPKGSTEAQVPDMLKSLLEDRFHLAAHRSTVQQPAYALVLARNGPRLHKPRDLDHSICTPWLNGDFLLPGGKIPQTCETTRILGDRTVRTRMWEASPGAVGPMLKTTSRGESVEIHYEFFRTTMANLAQSLSEELLNAGPRQTAVKVVDRTGISGAWDVILDSTNDEATLSFLTASLAKQGLRLERTTIPLETLVIDRLDKQPTEN